MDLHPRILHEPPVDFSFTLLHEDGALLAVSKSGDLPCHPAGKYRAHTLLAALASAGWRGLFLVHRLDRETSGVVVLAKSLAAASRLGKSLEAGRFRKRYLLLADGPWPAPPGAWIEAAGFICPVSTPEIHRFRAFRRELHPGERGQRACTRFRLLARNGERCLLEAVPMTGRIHQIRATAKALGLAVVGDKLYGRDPGVYARLCNGIRPSAADDALLGMARQALHAWKLSFPHPETGKTVSLLAPWPEDMRAALRAGGDAAGAGG